MHSSNEQDRLTATVDTVAALSREGSDTSVAEVTDAIGSTSHLTIILIAASIAVTPLSGIPGLSTICGLIIALTAAQALARRRRVWLPGFLRNQTVSNAALKRASTHLHKGAGFLDRHTDERLGFLVRGPARAMLYVICMICGLLMPVMEFIPFSASIAAGVIALFSIAGLTRDGLLAAGGMTILFLGATAIVWIV